MDEDGALRPLHDLANAVDVFAQKRFGGERDARIGKIGAAHQFGGHIAGLVVVADVDDARKAFQAQLGRIGLTADHDVAERRFVLHAHELRGR